MNTFKQTKCTPIIALVALACVWMAVAPAARANDWINPGTGWWNDPANWDVGVPNNSGGWAIGNIGNGGTAIITNTVPNVSEAWAGNSGVAGTIIVTNGGTLPVDNWLVVGRTGGSGNTPLSTLIVAGNGVINKSGDGFIVGDGTYCYGQLIVKDNAVVNVTGGWNGIGNGEGGEGWFTLQDNAVFNTVGYDWNIGDWGSGRGHAYIKDNATLNVSRFWVGKTGTTFGALWQSGGAIVGAAGGNEWCVGGQDGANVDSFGYIDLSAGTFSTPNNFQIGRNGMGVIYQSGGSITASGWTALGRFSSGVGVVWLKGGQFSHTGTGPQLFVAENGRGEFTVDGGTLDTNLRLRLGNPGGTGFVNFNAGTAAVPGFEQTGGTGYLSFNGGTVKARASSPTFLQGLAGARVFAGHAVFDTDGHDITVAQPLSGASGLGVVSIPILDGGAGYQAPPIVQIWGDGFNALAVAEINPATGTLTNIVITCPGYDYSSAFATVIGGGAAIPATLNTPLLAAVSSGGLIKNGAGTLTLTGFNNYTGPTIVNGGKLVSTTSTSASGNYTVADGAGLGVVLPFANNQLTVANLTLGSATGASLDFDLGAFGNPVLPALSAGALTVNGTITVNIADALPQVGQFPLLQYTSRSGAGTFVLGTLPTGVEAALVNNTANNSIDLNITQVGLPRWDGQAGGNWDIGVTTNWVELSTGLPTVYNDGLVALFDDAALGTTTVNLVATVAPGGVTVTNDLQNYTFVGSGKITGATGLTKQGAGSLTLAIPDNDYTGPTIISGGRLSVTNLASGGQPSPIGAASSAANNLVLAGGTLSYTGPAAAINRGYSVQAAGSAIETAADLSLSGPVAAGPGSGFVKRGAGRLTYTGAGVKELSGGAFPGYNIVDGTVVFDGSGVGQTNHSQNEFWVGGTVDTGANLVLSNTTLNVDSWFAVGRGNGSVDNLSTAALYNSHLRSGNASMGYDNNVFGNLARQTLILNGTSTFTNLGDINFGESSGSTSTILVNDSSILFSDWRIHLGWRNGGVGIMTLANSSIVDVDAWFSIGHEGGTGTLTVKDNSTLRVLWDMNVTDVDGGDGTMNIQDNARVIWGSLFVGKGTGSFGRVNQTGGSVLGTDFREAHVGFRGEGTYNLSGGSIVAPSHWFVIGRYATGPGVFNITGGTVIHGTNDAGRLFRVGEEGMGTLNISGTGVIETSGNALTLGNTAAGNGTINLNGGSLQVRRILGGPGAGAFHFNGGVLRAGPNANADFMTGLTIATVLAGGAVIDTGANNIGIAQELHDGGGNGGLTKLGTGALYLNGANTYTGPTMVNAGTLGGSGSIAGAVSIAAAATLAPGTSIGTLTIANNLTLNGTAVMEISKDGDVATSDLAAVSGNLAMGGTLEVVLIGTNALAVNDTFNLFDWGTRSGSFTTVNLPAGYTWDTSQLTVDGTIRVTAVVQEPTIDPPTVAAGNLILQGTGGTPLGSYSWLTSTDVAAPLANWTTNLTGFFDAGGAFSNAIPVSTSEPARFFMLKTP